MPSSLSRSVRLFAVALLGCLGGSVPALGQGCEQTYANGYFKANIVAVNACSSGLSCQSRCLTQVDVAIKTAAPCSGTSGSFLLCSESQATVGFAACGVAHLVTPASGANWGAIGGGLCQGYVNYVVIQ
jgi:hypothetical protein